MTFIGTVMFKTHVLFKVVVALSSSGSRADRQLKIEVVHDNGIPVRLPSKINYNGKKGSRVSNLFAVESLCIRKSSEENTQKPKIGSRIAKVGFAVT